MSSSALCPVRFRWLCLRLHRRVWLAAACAVLLALAGGVDAAGAATVGAARAATGNANATGARSATDAKVPACRQQPANCLQQVAPGVYVLPGAADAPTAANAGRVGNLGVLVGPRGVLVIDTGSSRARGEELLAAIRRVTPRPVVAVLISHPAQEFLFGNAPFTDRGIPVYADAAVPRLMAQRCDHCLDTLTGLLGAIRMQGTRLDPPQPLPAQVLEGHWAPGGRPVQVTAGPPGSVPGNLMIRDRRTGVVFSGALLSVGRVPAVQDTRPLAWRSALAALDDPSIPLVVPAYGAVVWRRPHDGQASLPAALAALGAYLQQLDDITGQAYEAVTPLAELPEVTALPAFAGWAEYQPNHRLNVFYRYLQREADDLAAH